MRNSKILLSTTLVLGLVACASNVPTSILNGTEARSKISIQFEEFPDGTLCQVETPDGVVISPAFPGRIEYPVKFRESPVTCTTPDNTVYDLLLASVLPEGSFKIAGITAYVTGYLVSTVSGESLTSAENESGVVKRQ